MVKRSIPKIEQLSKEIQELYDVLNEEGDLPVILVGASFLDASLSSILETKFISSSVAGKILDSRGGALGSFSARADVCYLLGLIDKPLYSDLLKIAEIRNEIAHHHLALSFAADSVKKMCEELSYVSTLTAGKTNEPLGMEEYIVGPRNQFFMTVVMISQRLLLIGLGLKREKKIV